MNTSVPNCRQSANLTSVNDGTRLISKVSKGLTTLLSILLIMINTSQAQVAGYSFSWSHEIYTSFTGNILFSAPWDDATSQQITLPFSFTYDNIAFTTMYVNTNGFITFGNVPPASQAACGLRSTNGNSIAAYATDLVSASNNSFISDTTMGNNPNRTFVIQWTDCDHYGDNSSNHLSFQIILNETSNEVWIRYGASTVATPLISNVNCTDNGNEAGQVGLVGYQLSDFNLRTVTNGSTTWATSSSATSIDSVCQVSSTNIPASGTTYIWTPQAPVQMNYSSSTTVFLNNTAIDTLNSINNPVIQIQIVTTGSLQPIIINNITLNTNGCTNPGGDLANAKVFYSGNSNIFSTATPYGVVIPNPNGTFTVTGSTFLNYGINYFWVTYDIAPSAITGDLIGACCTQILGSGNMGIQTPTLTCPVGSQTISNPLGRWVTIGAQAPDPNGGVMLLMTDGTVICKTASGGNDIYGNRWDKLTPDPQGSYLNGTWSQIDSMANTRLYFSTQVMKDGRVYVAGGEYGTGGSLGEIYDPVADTWSALPVTGYNIKDANSEILPNGNILQALVDTTNNYRSTTVYDQVNNTYSSLYVTHGIHNESMWVKLSDNSILFVDRDQTTSERFIPALDLWLADANLPVSLYDPFGHETGPAFLLPNGKAFFLGATGHTAIYTPSGNNNPGGWIAGPDIPDGHGMPDAAGTMMANGNILIAASLIPSVNSHFPDSTSYYIYDYLANAFHLINSPYGGYVAQIPSYETIMLDLPDGSILYSQQQESNSTQYYEYISVGSPLAVGKPTINQVIQTSCDSFSITGTLFNGISEGAAYGDDWQMESNYPIVRLTSGTQVYYARTYNWNRTGVMTGGLIDTAYFILPVGLPRNDYSLQVIANGNPSDTIQFIPFPIFTGVQNPPSVCSNTPFNYNATAIPNSTISKWTRFAVAGISNPAVLTPQPNPINETLINTTNAPVFVTYQIELNLNGCLAFELMTVSVNPSPVVSITNIPDTICTDGGNYSLSGTPVGGTFSGNGVSFNVFNPSTLSSGFDTITYSYTDSIQCSNTSMQVIFVTICTNVSSISSSDSYFNVYPNPATNQVTINFSSTNEEEYTLGLIDITGRAILTENHKAVIGNNLTKLNLEGISQGIYLLKIQKNDAVFRTRIVIQ
jgi:hypothetical protein